MSKAYDQKLLDLQKLLISSKDKLATVSLFTKKHYPKVLEPDNSFIGTNLKRYIYFDQTKAYLHAFFSERRIGHPTHLGCRPRGNVLAATQKHCCS